MRHIYEATSAHDLRTPYLRFDISLVDHECEAAHVETRLVRYVQVAGGD